jgi:hypothetical protein
MLPYATGTERQTCSDEDDRICDRVVKDIRTRGKQRYRIEYKCIDDDVRD